MRFYQLSSLQPPRSQHYFVSEELSEAAAADPDDAAINSMTCEYGKQRTNYCKHVKIFCAYRLIRREENRELQKQPESPLNKTAISTYLSLYFKHGVI